MVLEGQPMPELICVALSFFRRRGRVGTGEKKKRKLNAYLAGSYAQSPVKFSRRQVQGRGV